MATRTKTQEAHRVSVEYNISDIARILSQELGRALTAHLAGSSDPGAVTKWASGERAPNPEAEAKLRVAFRIFFELQSEDSAHTVRQWFIGMNPQLDDVAPADALRNGDLKDVLQAAHVYMTSG